MEDMLEGGVDLEAAALNGALAGVAAAAAASRGVKAFRPAAPADTHAALVAAASALDVEAVAALLGAGVRASMFDVSVEHCEGSQSALASALLGAEAAMASDGATAASSSCALRDVVTIATMLLDAGAVLRAPAVPSGRMPLCIAASIGHPPLMVALLRAHDAPDALRTMGGDGMLPARAAAGHGALPRDGAQCRGRAMFLCYCAAVPR